MCQFGPIIALLVGIQLGSPLASKSGVLVFIDRIGFAMHGLVRCFDLWARTRLGLAEFAGANGFGLGGLGGVAAVVAQGKNTSSVGTGRLGLAAHPAQQRIRQRLLCLDLAKLGAGAIYSLSRPDSMARLAMALCFAGLFDAPFVFSSPH